ncbi:hypothetical protein M3E13_13455 [Oceanobacillus kimchii]|uniref:hypothetical protein n=1 Tax=Oceanobacillus kimchii TaxID=746691 RepID=UPI0021A51AF5|nr:hypothetical protein [Oceanobacillus kimchii]MCT1577298.1 hypothetical protein [Oceanobacillus kimchii]MCT2136904.1 hypothetical protein [Oceanobacillus kimchii]
MFLFGCSGEAKEKTEEDYDELVELAFEDFWNNLSDKMRSEMYGDDYNSLREKSEIRIWEDGRYIELIIPRTDDDERSSVSRTEHEHGEFSFIYEEDFEKAIGDKQPVYVENKGEIKEIN